ncbi:MAG: DUF3099 domain-containing protein [Micrococcus sp.]|nr:DUF3099 domain-containing protein [Micrococcus sp.]
MSTRHAEAGRPIGPSRRDRSEDVQRITSAPAAGHIDRDARFVRYAWQMGIRTVCFVLAFFTSGWLQIVFFVLAIVLPYIAVVLANAGAVSNGEVLDAVPQPAAPELSNRLQLSAAPETLVGTTVEDAAAAARPAGPEAPPAADQERDHGLDPGRNHRAA